MNTWNKVYNKAKNHLLQRIAHHMKNHIKLKNIIKLQLVKWMTNQNNIRKYATIHTPFYSQIDRDLTFPKPRSRFHTLTFLFIFFFEVVLKNLRWLIL